MQFPSTQSFFLSMIKKSAGSYLSILGIGTDNIPNPSSAKTEVIGKP